MPRKVSSNSIALAGEFAVLSQLALRGFDANLTLGNTKGVDILASDPVSGAFFRIEVKTSGYRNKKGSAVRRSPFWGESFTWVVGKRNELLTDPLLVYCFVNLGGPDDGAFRFFVVPSATVADYVAAQHQLWLSGDSARKDTTMRVFRLGTNPNFEYPLPTPLASDHENNWELLTARR